MDTELRVKDIIKLCNGKLLCGSQEIICSDFCKDSREVKKDDVYIGIKGEKFNGSDYYKQALEKGARVCILQDVEIDKEIIQKYKDSAIIIVENVIIAIQLLSKYKRSLYNIPVVAITGSVGKTSTKDIVASVLSKKYNVLKTEGNYNNHIGVPLTILKLKNHTAMVVEMGMNNLGELEVLTDIAKPNIAIITNVGTSHIGNLGSRENILKAKLEIVQGLDLNGILVINNDNDLLNNWNKNQHKIKTKTYGIVNTSDIQAYNIENQEDKSKFNIEIENELYEVEVPIGGNHFVYNSLCAITIGNILEIPVTEMIKGIKEFELTKSRMEIQKVNNITIINDCYNANFDSVKAAVEYLGKTQNKRKIAILGDMLELGDFSKELHEKVGEEVINQKIDVLIVVGTEAKNIAKVVKLKQTNLLNVYECDSNEEAIKLINKVKKNGDCILVKASNGMKFKEIVDSLLKHTVK